MWGFKDAINSKYSLNLETYDNLYRWSIENISQFWAETWSFCGVEASQQFKKVRIFLPLVTCFGFPPSILVLPSMAMACVLA
jgi:hypothetical protein